MEAGKSAMKKVLVIDDSRTIRLFVSGALKGAGFDVLEAEDGKEALATIKATPDLSLIFCDVNLPGMDGLEVLTAMKSNGAVAPPTVMLTSEGKAELIDRAKKAGARGWLVKPLKPEQIVAVARKLTDAAPGPTRP